MKNIKPISIFLTLLLMATSAYAVKGKVSGKKGWIKAPRSGVHSVACNPGERFRVVVDSEKKTTISIYYWTLTRAGKAGSVRLKSENKTRHIINFRAPKTKPTNRMKYWNYEVRVHTGRGVSQTRYTITIR